VEKEDLEKKETLRRKELKKHQKKVEKDPEKSPGKEVKIKYLNISYNI